MLITLAVLLTARVARLGGEIWPNLAILAVRRMVTLATAVLQLCYSTGVGPMLGLAQSGQI